MRAIGPEPAHRLGMPTAVYLRYAHECRRWDRRWRHLQALREGLARRPVRRVIPR